MEGHREQAERIKHRLNTSEDQKEVCATTK